MFAHPDCDFCKKRKSKRKGNPYYLKKEKLVLLLFDLYFLRYEKPGEQWYELTDYLKDCLEEDGVNISYDDKNKDLLVNSASICGKDGNAELFYTPSIKNVISILEKDKPKEIL